MLDIHNEAIASINEGFHKFLLQYRGDSKSVYAVVEGKYDPMVYRSLIERFLPDEWNVVFVRAGNRKKVLDIRSSLDWSQYPKGRVCFFIDRDLSEFIMEETILDESVYVTDMYSIENSIVNRDIVITILSDIYNLADLSLDEQDLLRHRFDASLDCFQAHLVSLMAQIICWRRSMEIARLDEIDLQPLFEIQDGIVLPSSVQDPVEYAANCLRLRSCDGVELLELKNEFLEKGGKEKFIRGKYILWLLRIFVTDVHRNISKLSKSYDSSPKINVTISGANFISYVAPRARCPKSLAAFISRTFLVHVDSLSSP